MKAQDGSKKVDERKFWFKNVQDGLRRFKKFQVGLRKCQRFQEVSECTKKVLKGSIRF